MRRDRGYRLGRIARWKKRVRSYYGGVHSDEPRRIGWLSSTRTPCSCWMCGNPRRYRGEVTLQERRAELDQVEGLSRLLFG